MTNTGICFKLLIKNEWNQHWVTLGLGTNQNQKKYENLGSMKYGFVCHNLSLI